MKSPIKSKLLLTIFAGQLAALLLIASCDEKETEPLSSKQLAEVYTTQLLIALDSTRLDSVELLKGALQQSGISQSEYEAALGYFESQPHLWRDVFSKVVDSLKWIEADSTSE